MSVAAQLEMQVRQIVKARRPQLSQQRSSFHGISLFNRHRGEPAIDHEPPGLNADDYGMEILSAGDSTNLLHYAGMKSTHRGAFRGRQINPVVHLLPAGGSILAQAKATAKFSGKRKRGSAGFLGGQFHVIPDQAKGGHHFS